MIGLSIRNLAILLGFAGIGVPVNAQELIIVDSRQQETASLGVIIRQARNEFERKKFGSAIRLLKDALAEMPNEPNLSLLMADSLAETGKHAEAAHYFNITLKNSARDSFLHVASLNNSAWLLATSPDNNLRNGKLAVQRAKQSLAIIKRKPQLEALLPTIHDSLGAAFAERGEFTQAVQAVEWALEHWPNDSDENRRGFGESPEQLAGRLELYRQGKPFRQSLRKLKPSNSPSESKEAVPQPNE